MDKVRINPGNIFVRAGKTGIEEVVRAAKAAGIAMRVGVNAGSIEPRLLDKYGFPTPEAAVESALDHIEFCESLDFRDMIVSVKFSEVPNMIAAYSQLSQRTNYPAAPRCDGVWHVVERHRQVIDRHRCSIVPRNRGHVASFADDSG